MPDNVARFTISIQPELLSTFDEVCAGKGYQSRSEAVRDAIRDYLVSHEWQAEQEPGKSNGEVVGTITLLYDHDARKLSNELVERQQQNHARVLSSMHVHLDAGNSLEVVVVKGPAREVSTFADLLISLRGVKHGRLVCSTTGAELR